MKLRFAEEITLLMLSDDDGEFVRVPGWSMQCAYAGAVLMDLALEHRIDTDLKRLLLIDPTPVGDDLLDPTLALSSHSRPRRTTRATGSTNWPTPPRGSGTAHSNVSSNAASCDARTTGSCGCFSRGATRSSTATPSAK